MDIQKLRAVIAGTEPSRRCDISPAECENLVLAFCAAASEGFAAHLEHLGGQRKLTFKVVEGEAGDYHHFRIKVSYGLHRRAHRYIQHTIFLRDILSARNHVKPYGRDYGENMAGYWVRGPAVGAF